MSWTKNSDNARDREKKTNFVLFWTTVSSLWNWYLCFREFHCLRVRSMSVGSNTAVCTKIWGAQGLDLKQNVCQIWTRIQNIFTLSVESVVVADLVKCTTVCLPVLTRVSSPFFQSMAAAGNASISHCSTTSYPTACCIRGLGTEILGPNLMVRVVDRLWGLPTLFSAVHKYSPLSDLSTRENLHNSVVSLLAGKHGHLLQRRAGKRMFSRAQQLPVLPGPLHLGSGEARGQAVQACSLSLHYCQVCCWVFLDFNWSFDPQLYLLGDLIANTHNNLALVDCGVYFLDTVDLQGDAQLRVEGLVTEKREN